eukprot:gene3998-6448_t
MSRSRRSALAVIGVIGLTTAALYPIYHRVFGLGSFLITENRQQQFLKDQGLSKQDIQPTGLPVWTDPFDGRK